MVTGQVTRMANCKIVFVVESIGTERICEISNFSSFDFHRFLVYAYNKSCAIEFRTHIGQRRGLLRWKTLIWI